MVTTQREKVSWCEPEQNSDRYNLEVKLSSLLDTEVGINDCDRKKEEIDNFLKILDKTESSEVLKQLHDDRERVYLELETLKISFLSIRQNLEKNIILWQRYELMSENVVLWLKKAENGIRLESSMLLNPDEIEQKIEEVTQVQKKFLSQKDELDQLVSFSEQITDVSILKTK